MLLGFQWLAGVVAALVISPTAWAGSSPSVHPHLWAAAVLVGVIDVVPICLAIYRPGRKLTRHTIAIAQMFTSVILIHLTGGRIETHFHIFGSLAFLAVYRDWSVLITASAVVAVDHLAARLVLAAVGVWDHEPSLVAMAGARGLGGVRRRGLDSLVRARNA